MVYQENSKSIYFFNYFWIIYYGFFLFILPIFYSNKYQLLMCQLLLTFTFNQDSYSIGFIFYLKIWVFYICWEVLEFCSFVII